MKHAPVLIPVLLLAACGSGGGNGPAGVTAEESRALDEAAQMIESRRLPPDALAPMTPAPPASASPPTEPPPTDPLPTASAAKK